MGAQHGVFAGFFNHREATALRITVARRAGAGEFKVP